LFCAWGKTSGSLYILSKLKKKTIVIVHKEFLMNQWIERIQQFLPTAKIGKIQGQIIDIDGKDIVLCMLQSLVLKEYPSSIFDSFGLTIIDEVHHISSETFSNALFKVVTKYMLGLSATMNRKDGTTKVFKMFLGPVVHKAEKKADNNVQIRAVTYKTTDDDFNETVLDFKGQPQISSMISKLCSYNRRTEFIIKLLTDFIEVNNVEKSLIEAHKQEMDLQNPYCEICKKKENYLLKNTCCGSVKYCMLCLQKIEENAEKNITCFISHDGKPKASKERPKCPTCKKVLKYEQNYIENPYVKHLEQTHTIVLSHNLNVLHYIYKKFVCKNLASVGYYVGGMSEKELKNSETKQIILASFSMANEGLDIPTLNAEFLITPKTDIVQTIGRVLRAKHAFNDPIIYDIVDVHDCFQRQWLKRKAYYKKNNYNIISCDSNNYNKDATKWKKINILSCNNDNSDDDENSNSLVKGICFLKK
jgi:superfamily II DNA or RNA helicase